MGKKERREWLVDVAFIAGGLLLTAAMLVGIGYALGLAACVPLGLLVGA